MTPQTQDQYLDYLIDASIQGENRLFMLSFKDNAFITGDTRCFFSEVRNKGLQGHD